ncbi:LysE family translocator [Nocardia sp. NPDC088792]|uniref:LysE family translocator n=1 Tax=Nocardia sp. NPDC088792 TaxID=3364332 RepID=UPI00380E3820
MMSSVAQYATFAGVMLFVAISPGPDMAVIVSRALTGWSAGMAATVGVVAGVAVWVVAAVTGISALLATSAAAFTIVKIVGALYLVYLGVQSLLSARRHTDDADFESTAAPTARMGMMANVRRGFLSNILNPKAAVFFVALIPQFIRHDGSPVLDAIVLPMVAVAIVGTWYLILVSIVFSLQKKLANSRIRKRIDATVGVALVGVGIGVVFGTR